MAVTLGVVHRQGAPAFTEGWLEMHVPRPQPRATPSETPVEPSDLCFKELPESAAH